MGTTQISVPFKGRERSSMNKVFKSTWKALMSSQWWEAIHRRSDSVCVLSVIPEAPSERPWRCSACQLVVKQESGWILRECSCWKVLTGWLASSCCFHTASVGLLSPQTCVWSSQCARPWPSLGYSHELDMVLALKELVILGGRKTKNPASYCGSETWLVLRFCLILTTDIRTVVPL